MSSWWLIGFVIGVLVVLLVGSLVLLVTGIARKVARDIDELNVALEGTAQKTNALQKLATTNHSIQRITEGLRGARRGAS